MWELLFFELDTCAWCVVAFLLTALSLVLAKKYLSSRGELFGQKRDVFAELAKVPRQRGIPVKVCNTVRDVESFLPLLEPATAEESYGCIGLDCEWKPYWKRQDSNPVAVLQMSSLRICLLIRLIKVADECHGTFRSESQSLQSSDSEKMACRLPECLVRLLADGCVLKVGVNITGDAKKLFEDYGLRIRGVVEVSSVLPKSTLYPALRRRYHCDLSHSCSSLPLLPKAIDTAATDQMPVKLKQMADGIVDSTENPKSDEIGKDVSEISECVKSATDSKSLAVSQSLSTSASTSVSQSTASLPQIAAKKSKVPNKLDELAKVFLGIEMKKNESVTLSDWSVADLSHSQLHYAADDCIVSQLLFSVLIHTAMPNLRTAVRQTDGTSEKCCLWTDFSELPKNLEEIKCICSELNLRHCVEICGTLHWNVTDVKAKAMEAKVIRRKKLAKKRRAMGERLNESGDSMSKKQRRKLERKVRYEKKASRQFPLYDNCKLFKADGVSLIATCSRKTLEWYMQKGLATPLHRIDGTPIADSSSSTLAGDYLEDRTKWAEIQSIRLNFEPKTERTTCDEYYRTEKLNRCVVCGVGRSLVRYYVIPQAYRKCFPLKLKAHSSHDIVLLCHTCHRNATGSEKQLRTEMAVKFGISPWHLNSRNCDGFDEKREECGKAAAAISTALAKGRVLPCERLTELRSSVLQYFGEEQWSDELLAKGLAVIRTKKDKKKQCAAVFKRHASELIAALPGGERQLILTWRKHFLASVKPQFLPAKWSVHAEY